MYHRTDITDWLSKLWTGRLILRVSLGQKPVQDWAREDVFKWLAYLGMTKYEDSFRAITGKVRLLFILQAVVSPASCVYRYA